MTPVVAVIAPGMMGAAVGKRLVDNGVKVLTSLKGRSSETAARAKAAGMITATDEEIAATDFILSILPPGDALSFAERFVPALTASNAKPVFVECNAINPQTVERMAAVIAPTSCPFVDAGIIGQPPKPGDAGPRFYASGSAAPRFAKLRDYGLDVRVLGGAMSAASALKMAYAGREPCRQRRRSVRRTAGQSEGTVPLVQAATIHDAAEGLPLDRRDARDRRFRRRGSRRA